MIADLARKRITVMGLGRFGGGLGVTRWLTARGAEVLVTDLSPASALAPSITALGPLIDRGAVRLRLGEHRADDFTDRDLVVVNPAVPRPWENTYLLAAREAGTPLTTEIRLLLERVDRARVIGVTGSAGKSTTTAMIHHVLRASRHGSHLGGNFGGSLLDAIDAIGPKDWIVLELSSAMLYWLGEDPGPAPPGAAAGISPHVAVLTNVQPNHLDWHGTMEHYEQSKGNIFRYQAAGDHRVLGAALDPASGLGAGTIPLAIPGAHNRRNAAVALAVAARVTGRSPAEMAPLLADFPGLPHRLRLVYEAEGRRFYDDSKSTVPGTTVLAVRSFDDPGRVHLIAGGYDKRIDLAPISDLAGELAGFYPIGATGRALADAAGVEYRENLENAIRAARARMREGDVLLLSPGCASWDQFESFEQRGEVFRVAVEAPWSEASCSP